jgi:hypothetical protein
MLWNMVVNLRKGKKFGASNQVQLVNSNCGRLREEETMHQLPEDVEAAKHRLRSRPGNIGRSTQQSCLLLSLYVLQSDQFFRFIL